MKIKRATDASLLARLMAANINQTTPSIRRETPVEQACSAIAFAALAVGLGVLYIIFG
tara:strand:+ start:700 stop:873 length:174 start_codon:yes stop_codon:yes gene_type:complete